MLAIRSNGPELEIFCKPQSLESTGHKGLRDPKKDRFVRFTAWLGRRCFCLAEFEIHHADGRGVGGAEGVNTGGLHCASHVAPVPRLCCIRRAETDGAGVGSRVCRCGWVLRLRQRPAKFGRSIEE